MLLLTFLCLAGTFMVLGFVNFFGILLLCEGTLNYWKLNPILCIIALVSGILCFFTMLLVLLVVLAALWP